MEVVCGYAKMDRPKGMLSLGLKFLIHLMRNVKSVQVFDQRHTHMALYSLIESIYMLLKTDMMYLHAADKHTLVNFLDQLTIKISQDCPGLAYLLLADQTSSKQK